MQGSLDFARARFRLLNPRARSSVGRAREGSVKSAYRSSGVEYSRESGRAESRAATTNREF
jgi:hypothetical protein